MAELIHLTNQNFDFYFNTAEILVIDFWTTWCEPCKNFKKVFNEVANNTVGEKIYFGSVNVDEEKNLAQEFTIKSVPTLIIIRNQVMVFFQSGVVPKKALIDLLNQAIHLPQTIPFQDNHK